MRDILRSTLPAPKRKYRNVKRQVEGLTFDSTGELGRWMQLCLMQEAGEIHSLERQVPFILCPPVRLVGESRASSIKFVADFVYQTKDGKRVIEDWKGIDLPVARMERRLMKHIHGVDEVVTGPAARKRAA